MGRKPHTREERPHKWKTSPHKPRVRTPESKVKIDTLYHLSKESFLITFESCLLQGVYLGAPQDFGSRHKDLFIDLSVWCGIEPLGVPRWVLFREERRKRR